MMEIIRLFFEDEVGQGLVEYGLIILFVVIAVVSSLALFGNGVEGLYNDMDF